MILKHLYSEAIQWEWESVEIEIKSAFDLSVFG